MVPRFLAVAAAALLGLPGCGSEAPPETPSIDPGPAAIAGTWRVSGRTVEKQSGHGRDIGGTVTFVQEGPGYTAHNELTTVFPTPDGATEAQVVGTGEDTVEGGQLEGTADTQIILAQVPGVDAEFAFLPRTFGPRLSSSSVGGLNDDGSLTIEIENEAAEGSDYRGTRTSVAGVRIELARAEAEPAAAP